MERDNGKSSSGSLRAAGANLQAAIRRRAEEIYVRNGRIPGRDTENWMQAEQEILRESAESSARRAVVINVNGIPFVGEYGVESADGYAPGEFQKGEPVPVRFEGEQMVIQRPNGRELRTTLIKQVG